LIELTSDDTYLDRLSSATGGDGAVGQEGAEGLEDGGAAGAVVI
jgi:hypothetical protein